MGEMENDKVIREEFEHLIAEIEAFKDNYMDEMTKMTQQLELLREQLDEIKDQLRDSKGGSGGQTRLV